MALNPILERFAADNIDIKARRKQIVDFIGTTHDVETVKQLLQDYPDLCHWDEFFLNRKQLHCCIISLLVEAGMVEHKNAVHYYAVAHNDCLALAALLRDNNNNGHGEHPLFLPTWWTDAIKRGSAEVLNCLTHFQDPTPHIEPNRKWMEQRNIRFENGRFAGQSKVDTGLFITEYPLGVMRAFVDRQDQPDLIEQAVIKEPRVLPCRP